ncbi:preprotein translocase subunit TatC [Lampropedia puyangensis]|uniref:Preprotein translocase subunit TatC n=1 Tax=Lampropedia puyangensis TaxID=1330072 RepID=A0A4S8F031_9BURK|nr:group III truncated hemoglobin [Lampropedia puyangensis]THT98441.1 preprotein translocase subunit TatC [Lampropedia puyangensis]
MSIPPALCTEAEIQQLVEQFYARVRADTHLGPIFEANVQDWDAHLHLLHQFWSSVLLRTGRFTGSPMTKHAELKGLSATLFSQWLAIFAQVCAQQTNQAMATQALAMAERMAQSLWMGWQMQRTERKQHNADDQSLATELPRVASTSLGNA